MADIGSRILKARNDKNLTQKELGRLIGKDETMVSKWERDRNRPRQSAVALLAGVLGVSPQWILSGEGKSRPSSGSKARATQPSAPIAIHLPTPEEIRDGIYTLEGCARAVEAWQARFRDLESDFMTIKSQRDTLQEGMEEICDTWVGECGTKNPGTAFDIATKSLNRIKQA